MTKTNTAKPTASLDNMIYVGKEKFTIDASLDHISAVHDQELILSMTKLDKQHEQGIVLLQVRALYKSDKLFGQRIASSAYADVSMQNRNDNMYIAKNWAEISRLNKGDALSDLSAGAIRKRIAKATKKANEEAQAMSGNAPKTNEKPEAKEASLGQSETTEPKAKKKLTAEDLVTFVKAQMKEHGITEAAFNKVWFEGVYPQG